jgi:hypothetical protein
LAPPLLLRCTWLPRAYICMAAGPSGAGAGGGGGGGPAAGGLGLGMDDDIEALEDSDLAAAIAASLQV